ncbi:hypothetical protein [Salinisphaera sp. T31B1]|uniref:hypothetical protein n=1 Tax=Salinisphaera sp. T31B1 TaxID=727963 RepID=UPI00333E5F22
MSQPVYRIEFDGKVYCETRGAAIAQTAWHRVSRDRSSATPNTVARLLKDGELLAQTLPMARLPRDWPDAAMPKVNGHDVVKRILRLLRQRGLGTREIADAISSAGLPTSRSRIDALRGNSRPIEIIPAELAVLLDVLIEGADIE